MLASTIKEKINKIIDEDLLPHLPQVPGVTYERKQKGSGVGEGGLILVVIKYEGSFLDMILINKHLTFYQSNTIITNIREDVGNRIKRFIDKIERGNKKYTEKQLQRELDALDDIRKKFEPVISSYSNCEEYKISDNVFFSIVESGGFRPSFHVALSKVRKDMKEMGKKELFENFHFKVVRIRYDGHHHTNMVLPSSSKMLLKKVLAGGR